MQPNIGRWIADLSSFLHKTQRKTLLAITLSLCITGKLRSLAVAQTLADHTKVKYKSALQRFYRFVNGSKIDGLALWAELAQRLLLATRRAPVISIDWTEWRFGMRVLSAAISVGRRAVPVFVQSFGLSPPRSQNGRENTFVKVLISLSPPVPQGGVAV